MKTFSESASRRRGESAVTLVEMMITSTVFVMLMTGIIYTYIFALNLHENDRMKLSACDDARRALIPLVDQIRSANKVKIGSGSATNFVECIATNTQSGNAIQIFPTNNTTTWVQYYYDTATNSKTFNKLLYVSYTNSSAIAIAENLTNTFPVFSAEDSYGNPLKSNTNNVTIGVRLQFSQLIYPMVKMNSNNWAQNYQLQTRIMRRLM